MSTDRTETHDVFGTQDLKLLLKVFAAIRQFGGIGVSNIKYLENILFYDYSVTVMLVETGIKIALSKNLFLRGEIKHYLDPDDTSFDYYDYYDYDDSFPIATAFALGLEFKF